MPVVKKCIHKKNKKQEDTKVNPIITPFKWVHKFIDIKRTRLTKLCDVRLSPLE